MVVLGGGMPMQRGASLTTSEHIDPASPPAQLADMEDPDNADIPEGAIRFNVTAEDIACALAEDSIEVLALPAINVLLPPLLKTLLNCWHDMPSIFWC